MLHGSRRPAGTALWCRAIDLAARLGEYPPHVRGREADVRRGRLEGRRLLHPSGAGHRPTELDEADYKQPFYGAYGTYAGWENKTLDLLLHRLRQQSRRRPDRQRLFAAHVRLAAVRHHGDWLFEMEGGVPIRPAKRTAASISRPASAPPASDVSILNILGRRPSGFTTTTRRATSPAATSIGSITCFRSATNTSALSTPCSDRTSNRPTCC